MTHRYFMEAKPLPDGRWALRIGREDDEPRLVAYFVSEAAAGDFCETLVFLLKTTGKVFDDDQTPDDGIPAVGFDLQWRKN